MQYISNLIEHATVHNYYMLGLLILILGIPVLRQAFLQQDLPIDNNPPTKTRFIEFDAIKGLSVIAVILIHVLQFTTDSTNDSDYNDWGFFGNNIIRFTIPIFYMISGMLLRPLSVINFKTLWDFWRVKLVRIYIPYTLVSIYILWGTPLKDFWYEFVTGRFQIPYYFIIDLFQLYLLYPFLSRLMKYKIFLPLTLIFSALISLSIPLNFIGYFPLCGKYLFYFCLGMHLHRSVRHLDGERHSFLWWSLIIIHVIVSWLAHARFYNEQYFFGLSCFYVFLTLLRRFSKLISPLAFLGKISLWIYLLHYHILEKIISPIVKISTSLYDFTLYHFIIGTILSIIAAFICDLLYKRILRIKYFPSNR